MLKGRKIGLGRSLREVFKEDWQHLSKPLEVPIMKNIGIARTALCLHIIRKSKLLGDMLGIKRIERIGKM